ncbi:hypothetical protein A3I27_03120 [Candidatus Giovannonibacteria bacterium RIFCSPLOWO2_02_FULL_43_11b]|uniref:Uncharacterized protein n=1 Tax=Candidatus Giovannonibacteria bacterium RIFCSPHIGHO2_12_FULL_43_15 TaxID=1798341 RepID=A0A1F5WP35_9BACT|nr:MAG: hypothetical protein A2739_01360 [Candidatus Giovannonibacteria bacterium RIFCSPHIGHO2_01_FULL_43_100]OGF67750.1 MAG: hypothetical protein A3B97_01575 [Candidatus Giovannonibacteria bacterium RIFCSPHIGHO2_02_FULL_43_32]OGF77423.1 MAG: hypothetical protein A3F23_01625 [Candidatus Giovannonibacteria bacterium RIFCSPHIGHO2_12_FULL_43_15]OGF79040.1 MAG: hypothetical protein A3A15_03255 [Candidatus Giovannonibacteria bacterium RIFCSPLOWO2_01_FULL_43_60]OGF89358.1 MAG: hypothetical protein A3
MSRQNILTIILALSLLAGGYIWYSSLYPSANDENTIKEEQIVSPEFLAKTALLSKTQIDADFFKSGVFSELESGPALPPPPSEINGRVNPFAQF